MFLETHAIWILGYIGIDVPLLLRFTKRNNAFNWFPLDFAVKCGATDAVVKAVLHNYPEAFRRRSKHVFASALCCRIEMSSGLFVDFASAGVSCRHKSCLLLDRQLFMTWPIAGCNSRLS